MTVYDLAYGLAIGATAPIWLASPRLRPRVLDALRERTGAVPAQESNTPNILIHAVSLGEINATTALVRRLGELRPDLQFTISTTSRTGAAQADKLYANHPRVTRIRFPFDFSRFVKRMLDARKPAIAVMMELEVWPNFVRECTRRHIPAVLINGRLSSFSYRNYRLAGPLLRPTFARLALVCAQDKDTADRFERLGVPSDRIRVTGTMKFDTATVADRIDGAEQVAQDVGLRQGAEPIWVCGSTGPGEEEIVLDVYRRLLARWPSLRLVIIPRHPERFDSVAELIRARGFLLTRRSTALAPSRPDNDQPPPVVLGDTMGELRKFYSLADVVLVGRSLVDLGPKQHGSDMIEPAALSKPILIGPYTANFAQVMSFFKAASAIREVANAAELESTLEALLNSSQLRQNLGKSAQDVVIQNQGATERHAQFILDCLK